MPARGGVHIPLFAPRRRHTVIAPAPPFNPLTSISWHSAFWASDPTWTPPADGAGVSSWRNAGTCAAAATQGTAGSRPTYRAAYANLNGKPAVEFSAGKVLNTSSPQIDQPNHVLIVGWANPTHGANPTLIDSNGVRHLVRNYGAGGHIQLFAGLSTATLNAGRDNAFALVALFNGASSTLRMNGTAYTVPDNVGATGLSMLTISEPSESFTGGIAFVGVCDTALTAQQITDIEAWAKTYYGVPIP